MQKSSIVVAAPRLFLLRGSCRRRCGWSGRGGRRLCARRSGGSGLGGGRILSVGRWIIESGGVLEDTAGGFGGGLHAGRLSGGLGLFRPPFRAAGAFYSLPPNNAQTTRATSRD